jgi:transcription elongation factor Elf1
MDVYPWLIIRRTTEMNELLETSISCPYCGEQLSVTIETMDESQEYIEDCQVCCRPITFDITVDFNGSSSISVRAENETM